MARRRLYVFGGIIIIGILIGVFFLPNNAPPAVEPQDEVVRIDDSIMADPITDLLGQPDEHAAPPAAIVPTGSAQTEAETLYKKAMTITAVQEKYDALVKVYRLDPSGRWGGEAAAELGHMWKAADPEKAKTWYELARRAPISAETLARINAAMDVAPPRPVTTVQIKTTPYKVQAGDSLWKISKRFATTIAAIQKINNLTSDKLKPGMVLNIPTGKFDILVTKHTHTLQLLQDGKVVKVYEVALGANNSTPAGSFTVTNKLVDPVWYSPEGVIPHDDARNQLGSRWIGFTDQIGIHGTRKSDENTIGTDASKGCVRMRDNDVKELYEFVVTGKSKVTVVE